MGVFRFHIGAGGAEQGDGGAIKGGPHVGQAGINTNYESGVSDDGGGFPNARFPCKIPRAGG
jgi:hypothetical protein